MRPAIGHNHRTTSLSIALLAVGVAFVLLSLASHPAGAAYAAVAQCNDDVQSNVGGQGVACSVTIENYVDSSGGATSPSTITKTVCTGAAGPVGTGGGSCTTSSTTSADPVRSITQCNGSGNGGGGVVKCRVDVTNHFSSAPIDAVVPALIYQCVGSVITGAGAPADCSPGNSAGVTSVGDATVGQCNGSGNGGTSVGFTCSVSQASSMTPTLAINIDQCNGSANGGGALTVCEASVTNAYPAATATPTNTATAAAPTETATATSTATPTSPPEATPTATPGEASTPTSIPGTETATATAVSTTTLTPTPATTATPGDGSTATPAPTTPTATSGTETPAATAVSTATPTSAPATATPAATVTPGPTGTPSGTAPATTTSTGTPIGTSTAASTATAVSTSGSSTQTASPAAGTSTPPASPETQTPTGTATVAPSATTTSAATASPVPGERSASIADLVLQGISYSHGPQVFSGTLTLTAIDTTGSGLPWRITVQSSPFAYTGPHNGVAIPAANFSITSVAAAHLISGQAVDIAGGPLVPPTSPLGRLDTPRRTLEASAGFGNGTYTQSLGVRLEIPAQSRVGAYTGRLTTTISIAP